MSSQHLHGATSERWPEAMKGHTVVDVIKNPDNRKIGLVLDCGAVWFPEPHTNTGGLAPIWQPDNLRNWLRKEREEAQARIEELKKIEVIEALRETRP